MRSGPLDVVHTQRSYYAAQIIPSLVEGAARRGEATREWLTTEMPGLAIDAAQAVVRELNRREKEEEQRDLAIFKAAKEKADLDFGCFGGSQSADGERTCQEIIDEHIATERDAWGEYLKSVEEDAQ